MISVSNLAVWGSPAASITLVISPSAMADAGSPFWRMCREIRSRTGFSSSSRSSLPGRAGGSQPSARPASAQTLSISKAEYFE